MREREEEERNLMAEEDELGQKVNRIWTKQYKELQRRKREAARVKREMEEMLRKQKIDSKIHRMKTKQKDELMRSSEGGESPCQTAKRLRDQMSSQRSQDWSVTNRSTDSKRWKESITSPSYWKLRKATEEAEIEEDHKEGNFDEAMQDWVTPQSRRERFMNKKQS